jgi:hypothetical protein
MCLSLSATVILLCLFAPKLYIVLLNPSKNIQSKFKTSLTVQRSNVNNHLDTIAAATVNDRQRRLTPSDHPTEVSFCNSKLDSWAFNTNDQIIQTDNGKNLNHLQQSISLKADETTDLLSPSKQNLSVNYIHQTSSKPISSNLVISNENPWKKLSNVRYKLHGDNTDETDSSNYPHVYAQHITFV